jgi:hypothetical protein
MNNEIFNKRVANSNKKTISLLFTALSVFMLIAAVCGSNIPSAHGLFCTSVNHPGYIYEKCCEKGKNCVSCISRDSGRTWIACGSVSDKGRDSSGGTGATCPDGSSPDVNGKCPPITQGSPPSSSSPSSTEGNTNNNHNKGSNLSQLPPLSGGGDNALSSKPEHSKGNEIPPSSPSDQQGVQ